MCWNRNFEHWKKVYEQNKVWHKIFVNKWTNEITLKQVSKTSVENSFAKTFGIKSWTTICEKQFWKNGKTLSIMLVFVTNFGFEKSF